MINYIINCSVDLRWYRFIFGHFFDRQVGIHNDGWIRDSLGFLRLRARRQLAGNVFLDFRRWNGGTSWFLLVLSSQWRLDCLLEYRWATGDGLTVGITLLAGGLQKEDNGLLNKGDATAGSRGQRVPEDAWGSKKIKSNPKEMRAVVGTKRKIIIGQEEMVAKKIRLRFLYLRQYVGSIWIWIASPVTEGAIFKLRD